MTEHSRGETAARTVPDEEWLNHRINEAVNASTRPLLEQLAAISERLNHSLPPREEPQQTDRTPASPTPIGAPAFASYRTKPLPNPPKFSGRRVEYAAWSTQMRDKIALDAHFFSSDYEIWYLIYSCLDSQPQQVVATFYQAGGPGGRREPAAFLQYLDRTYADQNEQARAAATLRELRQRDDQPLTQFLPRFEKTIAQAGGELWPDSAKITFLEGALNQQLRRSLVSVALPSSYTEWLARVQEVAGRLEGLAPSSRRPRDSRVPKAEPLARRDIDGDTRMTGVNKLGPKPRSSGPPLAQKPRDTRRCYDCGKVGHIARSCPERAARATRPARTARAHSPRYEDARSEQLDDSDEDSRAPESGKE